MMLYSVFNVRGCFSKHNREDIRHWSDAFAVIFYGLIFKNRFLHKLMIFKLGIPLQYQLYSPEKPLSTPTPILRKNLVFSNKNKRSRRAESNHQPSLYPPAKA
jgi:hypothetical protein